MKIFVKAKAGAKENKIIPPPLKLLQVDSSEREYYIVSVKEPPRQGKANEAIIRLIAKYFKTSPFLVKLISGSSSKIKIFEIN